MADFYTPSQNAAWTRNDMDLSASGVVVLPNGTGPAAHPNLVMGSDKAGHLWMLDRSTPASSSITSMGGFSPTGENVVQYLSLPTAAATCNVHVVQNTPSFFNNTIYASVAGGPILAIPLTGGLMPSSGGIVTPSLSSAESYNYPTPTLTISGTATGANAVIWALDTNANGTDNCNGALGPTILRAYNAATLKTLYSSDLQSNDTAASAIKWQVPVVMNGHVYVAGAGQLTVYGLRP